MTSGSLPGFRCARFFHWLANKSHELFAFRAAMTTHRKVRFFRSISVISEYLESDTPKALLFQ
jgi:hypothetical protein